jgi:hypothetical protein
MVTDVKDPGGPVSPGSTKKGTKKDPLHADHQPKKSE